MTRLSICLCALFLLRPASGEVRRALLVGIDHYLDPAGEPDYQPSASTRERLKSIHGKPSRRMPPSLEGAVNDADAIREILISRFGFEDRNIIFLKDEEATADRILERLKSHLIDSAQPGDVSLFYYAGHGSRIRNTSPLNSNTGGYDSTLVPADAGLGVPDIRGKELARIYARAPEKGVSLTVILDSCYSGAASRGALAPRRIRAQPADGEISVDESLDGPLPEERGVLLVSAAQDYEPAAELSDSDLNGPHGAFTWALLHVLGASAPDEAVDRIFQRARALMQSQVWEQEPVLLARNGRGRRALFGETANPHPSATVAVARVSGPLIRLNGGLAANLHEDCELVRVSPASPEVVIRIVKVDGLAGSQAVVSRPGDPAPAIRPGDLFELAKWVVPDRELMRVWIGPAVPPAEQRRMSAVAAELRKNSVRCVDDPTAELPTHVLSWDGAHWSLRENQAGAKPAVLRKPSAREIARRLQDSSARLFIQAGPSPGLLAALRFPNRAILPVDAPEHADYALLGRFCGTDCLEYAWGNRKSALSPARTDWFPAGDAPAKLNGSALELAKIVGWLDLTAPGFESAWPYQLAFRNAATGGMAASAQVRIGERYQLMLRAAPDAAAIPSRRVYVFTVDSFGETKLLFGDNLENEFPPVGETSPPQTYALADIDIAAPYGIDNYFLLASATPIDNPQTVFNSAGVRTRGAKSSAPLARLLEQTASATRGAVSGIPTDWSIQRLTLTTVRGESK